MKQYYVISCEFDSTKRLDILNAINCIVSNPYIDNSNDECLDFCFTEDDGERVMEKLLTKYRSSADFFDDTFDEEEAKEMYGDKLNF